MNIILNILKWLIVLIVFTLLVSFASKKSIIDKLYVNHINIESNKDKFLSDSIIFNYIKNKSLLDIDSSLNNFQLIELTLKQNPYVDNATVFVDYNNGVNIEIQAVDPVARVFNKSKSYYLDKNSREIPCSSNFTKRSLIINGDVDLVDVQELCSLAVYIKSDSLWSTQISQVFIEKNADIILIPRVGGQKIIFGNASYLELKFNKLKLFYKDIVRFKGWSYYNIVNLKFNNQIVCTKN